MYCDSSVPKVYFCGITKTVFKTISYSQFQKYEIIVAVIVIRRQLSHPRVAANGEISEATGDKMFLALSEKEALRCEI